MTDREREAQAAAMKEAAAKITGKPAADLTDEQAEAALFEEIGRTTPRTDPAGRAAQRIAKKSAERNSRRAQQMTKGKKPGTARQLVRAAEGAQEVQEHTAPADPTEAAGQEHEAQRTTDGTPEGIAQKIHALSFLLDYMKSPEDALLSYNLPGAGEMLESWNSRHFARLVMRVAAETGADPAQIADKDSRTPEQQEALLHAAAREQIARFDAFFNSNYMQAMTVLQPIKGKYPDPEPQDDYSIKELAALYFFAINPEILPHDAQGLTAEHTEEIKGIFARMDAFFYDHTNGGEKGREPGLFLEFVRADSPNPTQVLELLPRIMATPPDSLEYPIDKINANIWEDLAAASKDSPNGQLAFAVEKTGSRKEATIFYSINFDELEKLDGLKLTKALTPFDKRVYIAVNAIYAQSGQYMSAGQVFAAMGNTGKPSKKQLEKVNESLTKMGAARVYLDNGQEIGVNKGYKHFRYDAPLLPFERVNAYINNALVESAIHLFREPPLMTFAKERNQITTITKKLLESPVNKTEGNLRIDDYLIERIARMKSGKGKTSRKMLYSTIYEKCQIKTRLQRHRTPETIRRYLDYYKECDYIAGYTEEQDGITIKL